MAENKNQKYYASNFQTVAKFRDLNNIHRSETEALVETAARLFRLRKKTKNPSGKPVPYVIRNTGSHNKQSRYKINLMTTEEFLTEYEKDKAIKANRAKGAEK